jgi:hypothetical protein
MPMQSFYDLQAFKFESLKTPKQLRSIYKHVLLNAQTFPSKMTSIVGICFKDIHILCKVELMS